MALPLIGAGLGSVIGGTVGALGGLFSAKSSRDFAEESYKHRYQWQVKDMQKAGLNPMLAFSQGAPNVPQPNIPNIGESVTHGAQAGAAVAQASTARKVAEAQIGQLESSSAANTANARKANAEAGVIEAGGNAKQTAEIGEIGARTALEKVNAEKVSEEINSLRTTNAQLEYMLTLERQVKAATAASLNAGIPPKVLLAEIAQIGTEVVKALREPKTKVAAASMFRDTVNHVEDMVGHGVSTAKDLASGLGFVYKEWMRKHGSAYR